MSNEPKVLINILTTHERGGWICRELAEFIAYLQYNPQYATRVLFAHNFIPAASARNRICSQAMKFDPRPDWICMMDNDMAPPLNILDCIKDAPEDADIVVPKFFMWAQDKRSVKLVWGMDESLVKMREGKPCLEVGPGFHPLLKTGTGCIFIRPRIFDKIKPPYFWYTYNEEQGQESSEDINFCIKVVEAGGKIYGNGGYDVGHYHNVNLSVVASMVYEGQDYHEEKLDIPDPDVKIPDKQEETLPELVA